MKQQFRKFTCAVLALALLLSLGLTALPAFAAVEPPQRGVITYTEPIAPQYEDARAFSEGLAAVKKDVKWGYIDHDNNVVIDFQYDVAYDFSEGKAVVGNYETFEYDESYSESWLYLGFVTADGVYTPFEDSSYYDARELGLGSALYEDEPEFTNGVVSIAFYAYLRSGARTVLLFDSNGALISDSRYGYVGKANEGLIPFQAMYYPAWGSGYFYLGGWMDMEGNAVHQYEVEYFGPEYEHEFPVGGTYIDRSYRYIYWVGPFTNGLAPAYEAVYDAETGETTNLMGFIDRATFDWVPGLEPQYESSAYAFGGDVGPYAVFVNGLAMVTKDGKRGAIDKRGQTVIPFQYESSLTIIEGLIAFQQDGKWGYLSGAAPYEVVIPARYEQVTGFYNGLAVAYDGEKAFLIDWHGNPVPGANALDPSTYFKANGTVHSPGEYVVIRRDGLYGFGHIEYLPELPEKTVMSSWAYDEVVDAIEEDLVPVDLQNLYRNDITRIEFCRVMVQAVEAALGQDIAEVVLEKTGRSLNDWQNDYPFTDTSSRDVIAAYALGIVQGNGNGTFTPNNPIKRQEAAVMLARAAKAVGIDSTEVEGTVFTDWDKVPVWAAEATDFVTYFGIMQGRDNGIFDPKGTFTREQSYMTALRLFRTAEQ